MLLSFRGGNICTYFMVVYRAHIVAHLPGLQMLDGRAVGPEEPQQAVQALRHQEVLTALMLTNACLVHKLVSCHILSAEAFET